MDWMYKDKKDVGTEEYLLGKPIDKEILNEGDEGAYKDAIAKARINQFNYKEDPVTLIEMKKLQYKKELLHNPVKLKKLKQALVEKGVFNTEENSADNMVIDDCDLKILKKWKKLRKSCFYFQNIALQEFASPFFRNKGISEATAAEITKSPHEGNSDPESDDSYEQFKKNRHAQKQSLNHGLNPNRNRYIENKSPSPLPRTEYRSNKEREKRKLEEYDRDDKLRQMRLNAEWNKDQRRKAIQHHKARLEKEERAMQPNRPHKSKNNNSSKDKRETPSPTFLRPMLSEMSRTNTLESRLKNNRAKQTKLSDDE